MRKRAGAFAILLCAIIMLVAAGPLVVTADTHHIVKGGQGPRASAISWEYTPSYNGIWYGHIVNSGLRSLVIDVEDITSGVPITIMHQRIRFAAYGTDILDTERCVVAKDRTYLITATPNGPTGSSCIVEDMPYYPPPWQPTFTYTTDNLTIFVDASGTIDPGGEIVAYGWDWGDGTIGTGVTASHTYAVEGLYTVVLTAMDNDGITSSISTIVTIHFEYSLEAHFTLAVSGMTVMVDASASGPADKIVAYGWDWGDGTIGAGMMASHTYATFGTWTIVLTVSDIKGASASSSLDITISPDMPPVPSFPYTRTGFTVSVDASTSTDDRGIVSYVWDWGDGCALGSGVTATHSYTGEWRGGPPPMPYMLFGFVCSSSGSPVTNGIVKIQSERTGGWMLAEVGGDDGLYTVDLNLLPRGYVLGDVVNITVWGDSHVGYNEAILDPSFPYVCRNVTLSDYPVPQLESTVTLTVYDTVGQSNSVSQKIVFAVP